jgi:probable rRNA maturation factor
VLDVEVLGEPVPELSSRAEIERLCAAAVATAGVEDGHLAVEFVSAERIAQLNAAHRGKEGPTDVLSFPIDGAGPVFTLGRGTDPAGGVPGSVRPSAALSESERSSASAPGSARAAAAVAAPPRELGDIVICPEHTADLREAIVHGALHLVGMDHETDDGEMLALQAELLASS